MKLAIIGSGPLALFCAQHFEELGAEVVVFQRSPLGGSLRFMLEHGPEMQVAYKQESLSVKSLWQNHLVSVIESLEKKNLTKAGEVLRVHKRFLSKSESISKHTRLHDLFRVIYSVNPKEAILKQLEENPEMFKQLGIVGKHDVDRFLPERALEAVGGLLLPAVVLPEPLLGMLHDVFF